MKKNIKKYTKKNIKKNGIPKLTKTIDKNIVNTINYNIFTTSQLLVWLNKNIKYKISFENLLKVHRTKNFILKDLVKENKNTPNYQLGYNNNEIITISRIFNNGYIDLVHTNIKFRGLKLCQISIEKFITNKKIKNIKKFSLYVYKKNIPAIKCYQNLGFNIIDNITDDTKILKNSYLMELYKN